MFNLNAKTRESKGKNLKEMRDNKLIPAIIYGHGLKSRSIALAYPEFRKVFKETGESSLVNLKIDDKDPVSVLIQDVQYNPISGEIQHIDFYQVKKGEAIHTEIELKFFGESKAIKELGGIFVKNLDKVKVKCLPKDLVHEIQVDISPLNNLGDSIRIKDLIVPPGIEILENLDEVIVSATKVKEEKIEEVTKEAPVVEKVGEVKAEEGGEEKNHENIKT